MPAGSGYGDGFEVDPNQVRDYGEGTRLEARELERSRNTTLAQMAAAEAGVLAGAGLDEVAALAQRQQAVRTGTEATTTEAIYGVDLLGAGATLAADNYDAADTASAQHVVEDVGARLAQGPITPGTSSELADR